MGDRDRAAERRPRERALIVVNPAAGGASEDFAERVAAACGRHLRHVSTVRTSCGPGAIEATAAAIAAGRASGSPVDVVVSVGGDGTAREVAEGIARAGGRWPGAIGGAPSPALLLVPAGRGNSTYRGIWGDAPWQDVLDAALSGDGVRVRELDLLRLVDEDRASLLGVNVGLLARIVRLAAEQPATGTALERYATVLGDVLEEFEPFQGRVTVDGANVVDGTITQVTVGGLRRWAGGTLEILPRSVLDDGMLDVCVLGRLGDQGFAEIVPLLAAGAHLDHPGLAYAQGRRVVIERDDGRPLELERDGDAARMCDSSVTLEMLGATVPTFTTVDAPVLGLYSRSGDAVAA
ncbi:MAG: hypothetical protein QOJ46_2054 [bacterium]